MAPDRTKLTDRTASLRRAHACRRSGIGLLRGQAKSPSGGQSRTSRLRIHGMGCGKWLTRIPEMLTIAARAALADLNEALFHEPFTYSCMPSTAARTWG